MTTDEKLGFAQRKRDDKANGILFAEDGARTLWLKNEQIAQGVLKDEFTLRDYYYNLHFLNDFPEIYPEVSRFENLSRFAAAHHDD